MFYDAIVSLSNKSFFNAFVFFLFGRGYLYFHCFPSFTERAELPFGRFVPIYYFCAPEITEDNKKNLY